MSHDSLRTHLNRRDWMTAIAGFSLAARLIPSTARMAHSQEPPATEILPPLNRFPRMVHEHFVAHVKAAAEAGNRVHSELKTKVDAETYISDIRQKIQTCFGPFPEKTPLAPRITGIVERDLYRIEKVIFESRPGFLVTANLYVPNKLNGVAPGVVGSCGHSENGKAAEAYQSFAQGLARLGYVVLIFDPIGQGERLQYSHLDKRVRPRPGVGEHLHAGNQQFLVGDYFGSWRAWDGIRALDYLVSRPEVDPHQVGVTGNSGGGTMTTWLCGLEQRWTMAAPSCFVTTFLRNLENELPADTEQCPPRALALHLDHADFLAALAPKPVIILAKEQDYFDVRGAEEAYRRLKHLYTLLDAPDNVKLFVGPTGHGYSIENREAMYQWFNQVTKISEAQTEPPLTIEKDETLWCTPTGQVADLNSRTVFAFTRGHSRELAKSRRALETAELKRVVEESLKLPDRQGIPEYRILRETTKRKYPRPTTTTYAVETEPGIFALVYRLGTESQFSRPQSPQAPRKRAILYVAHHSSDAELRTEPLIAEILAAEPESTLYTCDVRGIGESRPDTCGDNQFLSPYGNDFFYAIHSIMLDAPYVGQKTFDLLRVIEWLRQFHSEIHLLAVGWGTLPATFAALLTDDFVKQATFKHALRSYSEIAESELYNWPLSSIIPGVLTRFDLPDCYRAIGKKLRQIEPWGAQGKS